MPKKTRRRFSSEQRLDRSSSKPSKKDTGFDQPLRPHQHWHVDITYINILGTFYYL